MQDLVQNGVIIGILGATAVGKSGFAFHLAKKLGTDIVSADSMQIYKGFDIGTAKPTAREQAEVRHHLIDIAEPDDYFSGMDYATAFDKVYYYLRENYKAILMVGGTGFYFDSVLKKFDFDNSVSPQIREELNSIYLSEGAVGLHNRLRAVDEESAAQIHPNNVKRVMRALEIYQTTGIKRSQGAMEQSQDRYQSVLFELATDREELYRRINRRVDAMLNNGLLDEVRELKSRVNPQSQSMQGIGYKELVCYLDGECTLEEAVEKLKQNTRNYAKRQITYFKRMNTVKLDASKSADELYTEVVSVLENKSFL
ncbi:MAG: tRNA (adenosine(37)-N6)-dimethylallyltransferase MiaA [Clostridia bacterium]|nr:tRNA (adenosine(37)-N6)-dimethylallyltransferase MiaA [Clostridia bacterium]